MHLQLVLTTHLLHMSSISHVCGVHNLRQTSSRINSQGRICSQQQLNLVQNHIWIQVDKIEDPLLLMSGLGTNLANRTPIQQNSRKPLQDLLFYCHCTLLLVICLIQEQLSQVTLRTHSNTLNILGRKTY